MKLILQHVAWCDDFFSQKSKSNKLIAMTNFRDIDDIKNNFTVMPFFL